jgi:hypothetical protein
MNKDWVDEWFLKNFGRPIRTTQEDIDREQEEQEERDWYYRKIDEANLISAMWDEQAGRR